MTTESLESVREALVHAAIPHVTFDGWGPATFDAAISDSGLDPALARIACPRGGTDLARAYHLMGDATMKARLATLDIASMRFRDRIATAIRVRLEAGDREVVRRGMTLFSLPHHAAEGTALVWGTADAILEALGDGSDDLNWYTKRASVAGVFGSTVLYWLGDETPGHSATWDFLDRRIEGVMRVEKAKASLRKTPGLKLLMAGPDWLAARVKPPRPHDDLPGRSVNG